MQPSNILLDSDFNPVLGDFGLARVMHKEDLVYGAIEWHDTNYSPSADCVYEDTYVCTVVRGHMGSIAHEYAFTGKCTRKSDAFAFGNVLLEIVTGKTYFVSSRFSIDKYITVVDWVRELLDDWKVGRLVYPNLEGDYDEEEAKRLVQPGLMCSDVNPNMRPRMSPSSRNP